MGNFIKTFFDNLIYQRRHLFFRKYFALPIALFSIYMGLVLLVGYFSDTTNVYRTFSGKVLTTSVSDNRNLSVRINIKIQGFYRGFQTWALSIADAEKLTQELSSGKMVTLQTNILDLHFEFESRVRSIKVGHVLVYDSRIVPPDHDNIYSGIFMTLIGCLIFWISNRK